MLFDTGQPTGSGSGGELCAASCGAGATFQNDAGQFTLTEGYSISSAQAWIQAGATGGQLAVVLRADDAGFPGLSVFSQTFTVPSQTADTWVVFRFTNQPVLAANTPYWLSFEPVAGSALTYPMPGGAPSPLANYAFYNSRNTGWIVYDATFSLTNPDLGMRLSGTPAASPVLLVDTGAPTSTTNGAGIYNTSASNYEYVAGQFTLAQADSISSVEGWMQVGTGGSVNVNIYAGNGMPLYDGDIIPGTSVFLQEFTIPATPLGGSAGWVTFPLSNPYRFFPLAPIGYPSNLSRAVLTPRCLTALQPRFRTMHTTSISTAAGLMDRSTSRRFPWGCGFPARHCRASATGLRHGRS